MFSRHPTITLGTFGPPCLRIPVRLPVADLTSHVAITGATNSGKSRFLAHIALSLIGAGEGVTFLDPHGDAVRLVMAHLVHQGLFAEPAVFRRIAYLDLPAAARVWRYTPLNILDQPSDTPTTARLVLEALRRAWPALDDGAAPAFENAVLAGASVLIRHRLPLTLLHDLLTDAAWRATLLRDEPDATVRSFFARLDGWGTRERALYLESTLRRVFLLAFSPVLRYSLGQAENRLGALRGRMDRGESLLVNLALPDPDARALLGSFLTVFMEQGALQRADTAAGERGRRHTLLIDEAASVIGRGGAAVAHLLEQCRKFGLGLVLAGQSEQQYPEGVRVALRGVGTQIVMRLGRADAEAAARRIGVVDPTEIKHDAEGAAHPLYAPLGEQWEGWAATIQRLRPRRLLVHRAPPTGWLARRLHAPVARLRVPDLPDPDVDPAALAAVEARYLADWYEVRPVIEAELAALRPTAPASAIRRRTRLHDTSDPDTV